MNVEYFEVASVPDKPFDRGVFLETIGRESFMIVYELESRSCLLALGQHAAKLPDLISAAVPGLSFINAGRPISQGAFCVASLYRGIESIPESFLSDVFDMGMKGSLCIVFVQQGENETAISREYIERRLSGISVARSHSVSGSGPGVRTGMSVQHKDFTESDDAAMLGEMLESLNRSVMANGTAYKIVFAASSDEIMKYLLQRMVHLESHTFKGSIDYLIQHAEGLRGLSFGSGFARMLINVYGSAGTSYILPARYARSYGNIVLGSFMKDSVHVTGNMVKVDSQLLNLGFIISGLPGSGKTREAMAVLDSVVKGSSGTKVVIISPTDEWGSFALAHGMNLVRICDDGIPINFFRCPEGADIRRFYESLAMILASASAAGPYRSPMEKCLLNAFRRIYHGGREPDPLAVHSEVMESIIRMHAKRTNAGIKYTKHGENIKSAMENLVAVLQMPEYSEQRGICIEELLGNGVVFDISGAGVETKSHFYALLLNQVYSIASAFDSNGDDKLRLVICLEEAQMVLKDQKSPVVEDMRYRIQDFRKKGVGLILLAHSVSDIETGIRRLCQLKMYLKQAADVAEIAAGDLVFSSVKDDDVAAKLKHLDSRVGALSYISREGSEKRARDTVFVRTMDYPDMPRSSPNPITEYARRRGLSAPRVMGCSITFDGPRGDAVALRISYLGEEVCERRIDEMPCTVQCKLIEGRRYMVELLDHRGKVLDVENIVAGNEVRIRQK
ncbi:MAG: hypothetical protein M1160_02030 [Candidatus Marsarchaeota archaeon]|jgi:hypothetical protein|nr:hypothetical protein [Candidatus Marsarchaeota archaeon]MCL5111640.1 hypothetical protein [Candidatus Marsarchaeota archaeon]